MFLWSWAVGQFVETTEEVPSAAWLKQVTRAVEMKTIHDQPRGAEEKGFMTGDDRLKRLLRKAGEGRSDRDLR